jgi:TldD protein
MLTNQTIESVLTSALSTGGDFAEIFFEDTHNSNLYLVSNKIEKALIGRDFGVGIRIFKGLFSVYAYTNDTSIENLLKVAKDASAAISGNPLELTLNLLTNEYENRNKILKMPNSIQASRKIDYIKQANEFARNYSKEISQVRVNYFDSVQNILVANSDGLKVEDQRVRTRFSVESIAKSGDQMQTGSLRPGASKGFEFVEELAIEDISKEASRIAVTMLHADECPSGKMPVIIENDFGGVVFHEACGHGLEATSVAKGNSVFTGKIGEKVAHESVTAIDDGTLPNHWGTLNVDDEGTPTKKNILIENGILKGYMIDKLNGRRMNMESTGSARRQSYKFSPTSRMTNTFIDNGSSSVKDMIASTPNGLYCKYLGGGSVNTATGDFNFAVLEGYLIENGSIGKPVKGATIIGNGPEVLTKIDMVGNNLGHGQGMCGSISGTIPANVGQPAIRVQSLTVGGRK